MIDYKEEIKNTRVGCLGGSDARMLMQICNLGYVPKTAYERLAVLKGFKEQKEVHTKEMAFGDFVEQAMYDHLKSTDDRYESNPLWVSKKYSRKNVTCIDHPDIVLCDDDKKTLYIYEVKATKASTRETRVAYTAQLFHHSLMGKEYVSKLNGKWSVKVRLVHYNTSGLDLNEEWVFDTSRIEIVDCKFMSNTFILNKAMDIVDEFLETFEPYYDDEEIDADLLPENVKTKLSEVTNMLLEIREREQFINDFKEKLYEFLQEKGIKSIKNDLFSITRVDPSESVSFDQKAFLADYAKAHPYAVKKLQKKYERRTNRKGYATIKLK